MGVFTLRCASQAVTIRTVERVLLFFNITKMYTEKSGKQQLRHKIRACRITATSGQGKHE